MPPLPLTNLLHAALPHVSATSRSVLSVLACRNGLASPAAELAAWVGLRDRHQLARCLRGDGLPPLERLAAWVRVLYWMLEAESSGRSLFHLARRERFDPAMAYRLVHRVTGLSWSQARRAGLASAVSQFREQCNGRGAGAQPPAAPRRWATPGIGQGRSGWAAYPRPPSTPGHVTPRHPTGVLAETLAVPGYPFDVTVAPNGVAWVTRGHAAALECLQLAPFRTIGSVLVGVTPTRVVLSPAGNRAWVTNQFTQDVAVVDLIHGRRTEAIPVEGDPLGEALSPDGRILYVVTNLDRLYAISVTAARVVGSVGIPAVCTELAVHPAGHRVYVPTWEAGLILEVDARSLEITRRFTVGGRPHQLVLTSDGLLLYAANEAGWLDVLQLARGERVHTIPFGTPALSVAFSPDEAVLFVGLLRAGRVVRIDCRTLQILGSVETGGKPRHIAFDPTGECALIANESGWVDLVR
jgi:DNA-binding beta-propeller fold protein YncE